MFAAVRALALAVGSDALGVSTIQQQLEDDAVSEETELRAQLELLARPKLLDISEPLAPFVCDLSHPPTIAQLRGSIDKVSFGHEADRQTVYRLLTEQDEQLQLRLCGGSGTASRLVDALILEAPGGSSSLAQSPSRRPGRQQGRVISLSAAKAVLVLMVLVSYIDMGTDLGLAIYLLQTPQASFGYASFGFSEPGLHHNP